MWFFGFILLVALLLFGAGAAIGSARQMDHQPQVPPFASYSQSIKDFAAAITEAENSDPAYNNPGDLKPPGWTGPTFGAGIARFSSPTEGIQRLYYQLSLIALGESHVYTLDDTIMSMAIKWTGNDNSGGWAQTVAANLGDGVTTDTPLRDVLSA